MSQDAYVLGPIVANTLQGCIYEAKGDDAIYIVKQALARCVVNHKSKRGDHVLEDFRKERNVMLMLNDYEDRPTSIARAVSSWDRVGEPGEEDAYFLMMEKGPGVDFFDAFASFFSVFRHEYEMEDWKDTVRHVFGELSETVAWLHSKNVAHLDISAENLLFDRDGSEITIRLIDFGVAELCEDGNFVLSGECRGKTLYMAPEVSQGRFDAAKADVWSMGVLLLTTLSGNHCWQRADPTDRMFTVLQQNGVRNVLQCYGPVFENRVPEEACDLLDRMFMMEGDRISAEEVLAHPYVAWRTQSAACKVEEAPLQDDGIAGSMSWMTDGVHSSAETLVNEDLVLQAIAEEGTSTTARS